MTPAAARFVTPLTFQTLSNNPVYIDMFALSQDDNVRHISLSDWADAAVIAPLSANTLSKIACGICDNLLTTVICALPAKVKVIMAPAMNNNMWHNPLVQDNVKRLRSVKSYCLLEPQKGRLACGVYGAGRMPEPEEIFKAVVK